MSNKPMVTKDCATCRFGHNTDDFTHCLNPDVTWIGEDCEDAGFTNWQSIPPEMRVVLDHIQALDRRVATLEAEAWRTRPGVKHEDMNMEIK